MSVSPVSAGAAAVVVAGAALVAARAARRPRVRAAAAVLAGRSVMVGWNVIVQPTPKQPPGLAIDCSWTDRRRNV